ncbi:hypothetical protein KIN20_032963 [Parelaphostrongylus tenuis]|uniref:Uncharacterized protein n=1 Tax=Parelaphostrongylus tenuis TaxID=148309 RepID=A0AAD5R7W0_PARTN|nr:hypothetical protein KIN20_032963 [Parelaphostrongylus tenuis]
MREENKAVTMICGAFSICSSNFERPSMGEIRSFDTLLLEATTFGKNTVKEICGAKGEETVNINAELYCKQLHRLMR